MSSGLKGRTLGQYQLTERLGKGGMAEVYKAYQPSLDRFVAIKVLHAYFAEEQDFRNRFQREARAVARLRHANIVQIYDFGAEGDIYYMAMEFLDGGTLKQRLREAAGFMPRPEVLRIVERVALALDYAHARGIYHRDVKPANVMLTTDNQVILTDFGLAKMAEGSQYTRSGLSVGTPEYMAPEQGQGLPVDHRADVYSLGVMLYELLTGQLPYTADTPVAIIFKHIKDPLPLPRAINADLPEPFERVVLKALAKAPDDRYQSAGELAAALRRAMTEAGEDLPTPPPNPLSVTHIPAVAPAEPAPATKPPVPPATPIEPGIKRAVSRLAGAAAEDDWDAIGQQRGERLEAKVAVEAANKPGRGGKKWFLAGCLTSLALLACCIGLILMLGVCNNEDRPLRTPNPQHTPAPPPETRWQPYEGLGLTMHYPVDWEKQAVPGPLGEGVQFASLPRPNEARLIFVVHAMPVGPGPLDRLLENWQGRILANMQIRESGEIETRAIGGEAAVMRRVTGADQDDQPFFALIGAVTHGERTYILAARAPVESDPEARPIFESMFASIEFAPAP